MPLFSIDVFKNVPQTTLNTQKLFSVYSVYSVYSVVEYGKGPAIDLFSFGVFNPEFPQAKVQGQKIIPVIGLHMIPQ